MNRQWVLVFGCGLFLGLGLGWLMASWTSGGVPAVEAIVQTTGPSPPSSIIFPTAVPSTEPESESAKREETSPKPGLVKDVLTILGEVPAGEQEAIAQDIKKFLEFRASMKVMSKAMSKIQENRYGQFSDVELAEKGTKGYVGQPWLARAALIERGTPTAARVILDEMRQQDLDPSIRGHYALFFGDTYAVESYPEYEQFLRKTAQEEIDDLSADALRALAKWFSGNSGLREARIQLLHSVNEGILKVAINIVAEKGDVGDITLLDGLTRRLGEDSDISINIERARHALKER